MAYLNDLKWQKKLNDFKDDEQKVMLVLSNDKHKWRTRNRIIKSSGLTETEVENVLSKLLERSLVRQSFSKSKKIIYGLVERVK